MSLTGVAHSLLKFWNPAVWRVLRWVLLAFAVLIVVIAALPFLLPTSVYKEQLIKQTRLLTGRELKIDGDLNVSFWPTLSVVVEKVRFANAPGAAERYLATMESLVVGAELFPLLSGDLKVTEIKLVKPVINLEIDAKGRGNWRFTPSKSESDDPTEKPEDEQSNAQSDLSFSDVNLTQGVLTYRDARTKTAQRVDAIDASVKLPSLDQPMLISGGMTWNTEVIAIEMEVSQPRALSSRGKSAVKAKIDGDVLKATFDGTVDASGREIKGDIDLQTESAQRLAAWAGVALPKVKGFGPMTLSGKMSTAGDRIAFIDAKLALDDMKGSGNLALEAGRETPRLTGDFTLDRLDINPYLGREGEPDRNPGEGSGWSEESIDLSALRYVDANFAFAAGALTIGEVKIGRSALDIVIAKGKLRADLKELALYGGSGRGVIALDGSDTIPRFGLDFSVGGVDGAPFLRDAIGAWRLSGTGSIVARVTGSGRSERAWMRSLNGEVAIRFRNGAIKGVDLGAVARTIETVLTGSAVGPDAKTNFSDFGGSFVIREGVAANRNLRLINPEVRLDGVGIVNIGNESIDYHMEPRALSSRRGLGRVGIADIGIPFRIKGNWDHPSYEPDLTGVLPATLDAILESANPLDKLKAAGDGIDGLLEGIGGQPSQQQGASAKKRDKKKRQSDQDPLDQLRDLFGGDR